jgi:chromosome segregation ATPase
MANDKKNINELVTDDDDPTAELEALDPGYFEVAEEELLLESSAGTCDYEAEQARESEISVLKSDLQSRAETIDRLQYDIEQLRARWNGLELEIQAREKITDNLNRELDTARQAIERKEKLIRKRDQSIRSLKAEIRERNETFQALQASAAEIQTASDASGAAPVGRQSVDAAAPGRIDFERQAGELAANAALIEELRARIVRLESYADSLRQKLQDSNAVADEAESSRDFLVWALDQANARNGELETALGSGKSEIETLQSTLAELRNAHEEELRMVRFELGEAQETVAQHELVAEQLASDLVDTRGYRDELEKMLNRTEEASQSRIQQLETENRRLLAEAGEKDEKLASNSEAISCLLAELARKSQQIESIGKIEGVIHDIDSRMSERFDERATTERERLSRVLIGSVDGQELRFPLFKNRLTIGRTDKNDIQLKASYISRRHAVVVTDGDTTRLIDWGSKNGVFVNSRRITEHFLKNGDTVTIGTAEFRYEERPKRDA